MQIIPETWDWLALAGAFGVGIGLGLFFYGGLWWTVRRLPEVDGPGRIALLTIASFVVRTGVVLVGLYLVMDGRWQRLVAAVVGFIIARMVLVHRYRPDSAASPLEGGRS
jgi:F1F0 ATPase subunit 2